MTLSEQQTYEVNQHLGWLKMYVLTMNEYNWRDMRLHCEHQLHRLSAMFPDGESECHD